MSAGWFYKVAEREFGPCSSAQLVAMAKSGQLMPNDQIRRTDGTKWVEAGQLKGLMFSVGEAVDEPPPLPIVQPVVNEPPPLPRAQPVAPSGFPIGQPFHEPPPLPGVKRAQPLTHAAQIPSFRFSPSLFPIAIVLFIGATFLTIVGTVLGIVLHATISAQYADLLEAGKADLARASEAKPSRPQLSQAKQAPSAPQQPVRVPTPDKTLELFDKLSQPAPFECIELKLSEVLKSLSQEYGIAIRWDAAVPGKLHDTDITINLHRTTRGSVLSHVLAQAGLDYFLDGEAVLVVTPESARRRWDAVDPVLRYLARYQLGPVAESNQKEIARALNEPTELEFVKTPLTDVTDFIATRHQVEILLDSRAFERAMITLDSPVSVNIKNKPLATALGEVLDGLGLGAVPDREVLLITTKEIVAQKLHEGNRAYEGYVEALVTQRVAAALASKGADPQGAEASLKELEPLITQNMDISSELRDKLLRAIQSAMR